MKSKHFQMHFLEWKSLYFDFNLSEICSQIFNLHWVGINSGDGSVLKRQQAITWTNVDQVSWYHLVSLNLSELNNDVKDNW